MPGPGPSHSPASPNSSTLTPGTRCWCRSPRASRRRSGSSRSTRAWSCGTVSPSTPADREQIAVTYPARFELHDAATLIDGTTRLQLILQAVGNAPETEQALISATVRQLLVGLGDDEYKALDDEIELLVATKSQLKEQMHEMQVDAISSRAEAMQGSGSAEQQGGEDPTGQSGGTMISNMIPSVV